MTNPIKTWRRSTVQQKPVAVELCLQESLSCIAVDGRLGLPSNSLARCRIDCGQPGHRDLALLASEDHAELSRLRKEMRELRREKDLFRLEAAYFALRGC